MGSHIVVLISVSESCCWRLYSSSGRLMISEISVGIVVSVIRILIIMISSPSWRSIIVITPFSSFSFSFSIVVSVVSIPIIINIISMVSRSSSKIPISLSVSVFLGMDNGTSIIVVIKIFFLLLSQISLIILNVVPFLWSFIVFCAQNLFNPVVSQLWMHIKHWVLLFVSWNKPHLHFNRITIVVIINEDCISFVQFLCSFVRSIEYILFGFLSFAKIGSELLLSFCEIRFQLFFSDILNMIWFCLFSLNLSIFFLSISLHIKTADDNKKANQAEHEYGSSQDQKKQKFAILIYKSAVISFNYIAYIISSLYS